MSTQQHLDIVQSTHLLMIDSYQSIGMQALHLHTIMYNIAKTIQRIAPSEFLLCLLYGSGNAKAETTTLVYFYFHINFIKSPTKAPHCPTKPHPWPLPRREGNGMTCCLRAVKKHYAVL